MLRCLARFVLLFALAAGVPVQGFAAASGLCRMAGHVAAHASAIGHGSASAQHPGQDGDDSGGPLAEAHCAVSAAMISSMAVFVRVPLTGGAVPAVAGFPSAFVPPGLDRPPLSLLV